MIKPFNNKLVSYLMSLLISVLSFELFAHGIAHERLHDLTHQIENLSQAQLEKKALLYIKRGKIYQDSENYTKALNDYVKAGELNPQLYTAIYWQGYVHFKQADYSNALRLLKQYLQQVPHSPLGHKTIAAVYMNQLDYAQSVAHYDKAIHYDQNPPPQIYLERAQVLSKMLPLPLTQIESGLQQALLKHGPIISLVSYLVQINIQAKNYSNALKWFDYLPISLQNTPAWLLKKADVYRLAGNYKKALNVYRQVVARVESLSLKKAKNQAILDLQSEAETKILQLARVSQ